MSVKVLGILGMIDEGETDWKVIAINTEDPHAKFIDDVDDLDTYMPGTVAAIRKWLTFYKTPHINEFAFDGECKSRYVVSPMLLHFKLTSSIGSPWHYNREFALTVLEEAHDHWRKLISTRGGFATV